jgi:hypothetical protein
VRVPLDPLTEGFGPEVGALFDAARDLAPTPELRPLLELLLDQLGTVVDFRPAWDRTCLDEPIVIADIHDEELNATPALHWPSHGKPRSRWRTPGCTSTPQRAAGGCSPRPWWTALAIHTVLANMSADPMV